jgi:hypothetical protein
VGQAITASSARKRPMRKDSLVTSQETMTVAPTIDAVKKSYALC